MSYSLSCDCGVCKQKSNCVDSAFVQAAISGIHAVNWVNGTRKDLHLGSGSIVIQCNNFDDERTEPQFPTE